MSVAVHPVVDTAPGRDAEAGRTADDEQPDVINAAILEHLGATS